MEFLTHALLGAVVGELILGKRLGNHALVWGALAGLLPYLDSAILPFLDTANRLGWQRGPSHSILIAIVASSLLAKPLAKSWKRQKISKARAGTFVLSAWFAHIALDCLGPAGVAVWWPLPLERVALAILPPSDPLVLIPLLVGIPWLATCRDKKSQHKRRRILAWSCGLFAIHLLTCFSIKLKVSSDIRAHVDPQEKPLVLPTRHNALLWRVLVHRGDTIKVAHRSIFHRRSSAVEWIIFPTAAAATEPYAGEREFRRIHANTGGFWIARSHRRGLWIADLRAGETREFGKRDTHVDLRMRRAWNFEPEAPKDRLFPANADSPGTIDELRQIRHFITAKQDLPDHAPRLAGVPGQFPEALSVTE